MGVLFKTMHAIGSIWIEVRGSNGKCRYMHNSAVNGTSRDALRVMEHDLERYGTQTRLQSGSQKQLHTSTREDKTNTNLKQIRYKVTDSIRLHSQIPVTGSCEYCIEPSDCII
jgi:hypothetical protein